MVLELKHTVMIFVAQLATVFANPFHVAILARVETRYFTLLPLVGKTISVDLDGNTLDFDPLPTQRSDLLIQVN